MRYRRDLPLWAGPCFLTMIKTTGITAEYDPLHNGHVYLIEQARALTQCDAIAVAMSGDYVQRGEPAMLDKWTRCRMALDAGADLVVEIPVQFCLGNAAQYASASVSLLEALGCSQIAFGSESGDVELLKNTAHFLVEEKEAIDARISELIKDGISYPAARAQAYWLAQDLSGSAMLPGEADILSSPNDILALEYIKNMKSAEPVCVKRQGAGYSEGFDESMQFQSASAIREAVRDGSFSETVKQYMPETAYKALCDGTKTFNDDWVSLLKYAAMSISAEAAEDLPSAGEGLGGLIKTSARDNSSWEEIVLGAKSKRYTYTRISRLCMQMILGIRRSMYSMESPAYVRVLGFSDKGRELLSGLKKEGCVLPVITNINKEASRLSEDARRMLDLDVFAADIYNMITGRGKELSDHVMRPVIK